MVYAAYRYVVGIGIAENEKKWAPLHSKCSKDNAGNPPKPTDCAAEFETGKVAIAANLAIQEDVKRIDGERQACTASINGWKALADRAATVAQQNAKAAEGAINQLRGSRDSSLAKSRRPTANESCEQILDELDKDSLDLAQKRAILFPGEKPLAPVDRVRVK
ncbi:MAG TPA: hypothetical protein VF014_04135 [Casimicrobiaceae bacterium]|nr:hypothetical protein [Casimicrobiaceae bacterium]